MHNGRDKMPTTCKLGPGTLVWKLELPSHIEKYAGWAKYECFSLIVKRKINMNNLLCQLKMCKYILNSGSEPDSVSVHLEPWQPEIKGQLQNWSTRTHIPTIFNGMMKISLSWSWHDEKKDGGFPLSGMGGVWAPSAPCSHLHIHSLQTLQ